MQACASQHELGDALGISQPTVSRALARTDCPVKHAPPWTDHDVAEFGSWLEMLGRKVPRPPKLSMLQAMGWTAEGVATEYTRKGLDEPEDPTLYELNALIRNVLLAAILARVARRMGLDWPSAADYNDGIDHLAAMPRRPRSTWQTVLARATVADQRELLQSWNIAHFQMLEARESEKREAEHGIQ